MTENQRPEDSANTVPPGIPGSTEESSFTGERSASTFPAAATTGAADHAAHNVSTAFSTAGW